MTGMSIRQRAAVNRPRSHSEAVRGRLNVGRVPIHNTPRAAEFSRRTIATARFYAILLLASIVLARSDMQPVLELRVLDIIPVAQEAGVYLAVHSDRGSSRFGFHLYSVHGLQTGVYGIPIYLRADDLLSLSTGEALERIFQGLGIPAERALCVTALPAVSVYALPAPDAPVEVLFRPHELALLKLLAWEVAQGRRDPHGVEDSVASCESE
jgi:hypothetical protein